MQVRGHIPVSQILGRKLDASSDARLGQREVPAVSVLFKGSWILLWMKWLTHIEMIIKLTGNELSHIMTKIVVHSLSESFYKQVLLETCVLI